jgi:hypothetical protein
MRFISSDSIVPDPKQSMAYNRFAYAYNNPVTLVDPDGHEPVLVAVIVGAVVGGTVGTIAAVNAGLEGWDIFFRGTLPGLAIGGVTAGVGQAVGGVVAAQVVATFGQSFASTILASTVSGVISQGIASFGIAVAKGFASGDFRMSRIWKETAIGAAIGGAVGGLSQLTAELTESGTTLFQAGEAKTLAERLHEGAAKASSEIAPEVAEEGWRAVPEPLLENAAKQAGEAAYEASKPLLQKVVQWALSPQVLPSLAVGVSGVHAGAFASGGEWTVPWIRNELIPWLQREEVRLPDISGEF